MSIQKWPNLYPYAPGTSTVDGFPGHYILADRCLFRLHHHVLSESGVRYIISTVGYMPDEFTHRDNEGGKWHDFGVMTDDPLLCEMMVFEESVKADGHMEMVHPELKMYRSMNSIEAIEVHMNTVAEYCEL